MQTERVLPPGGLLRAKFTNPRYVFLDSRSGE